MDKPISIRDFSLFPDKLTRLTLDINFQLTYTNLKKDRSEIVKMRDAGQVSFSYIQNEWLNNPSPLKNSTVFNFSVYQWYAFSKHMGFLIGGGLGLSNYSFYKDTTSFNLPQFKKRYENYTYFEGHLDMKFRITSANQQKESGSATKFTFDIGTIYNLPILFKHMAFYDNNKRIVNSRLHQYTDARAYINLGYSNFSIFCEYRIFDFILGKYPELPTYNSGIRLLLH